MRIGDVLKMAEYIEREKVLSKAAPVEGCFSDMISAYDVIMLPAADVAPVRHGRWVQVIVHVEFEDGFVDRVEEYCSACHEPNERRCTYFCHNCGAKMDLPDECKQDGER